MPSKIESPVAATVEYTAIDAKPAGLMDHFATSRGSAEKITLEWSDINYSTVIKDSDRSSLLHSVYKERHILKGINGKVESGQLLSIMGPSGCGKTSLLNILSARCPAGGNANIQLTGSIQVNGVARDEEKFRRISAYVLQDDYLYPHLTVYETLSLAANFFLDVNTSDDEKRILVDNIIRELGLNKARDTIIGNDKVRGVSGGERKRVAVAVQLISDPLIIFLDEPTSGLDSFQAQSVMESCNNLAANGRLVVTVIHQPRSSIFNMCDRLLLLCDGMTMYFGKAQETSLKYFSTIGYNCPENYNPGDYFIDLISQDNRSSAAEEESVARIKHISEVYRKNEVTIMKSLISSHEGGAQSGIDHIRTIDLDVWDGRRLYRNLRMLAWRSFAEQSRDLVTFKIKLILSIFFSALIGGIYSNVGYGQSSIQNRSGLFFFIAINTAFTSFSAVLNTFPKEKTIVWRERSGRAYDTVSYFVSKVLVEIPLNIVPAIVYACILYWIVGLNAPRFGYFILILMLHVVVTISLGLFISSIAPNVDAANAMGVPFLIIGILFGGFYIDVNSLPIVANWVPYISFIRWSFQALLINEFKGLEFNCDIEPANACIMTGEEYLKKVAFDGHTTAYAVFGMGMLLLCYLTMAFTSLIVNGLKFTKLNWTGAFYGKTIANSQTTRDTAVYLEAELTAVSTSKTEAV